MTKLFLDTALLPAGWADDVLVEVDDAGTITSVTTGVTTGAPRAGSRSRGVAIPGVPNLHSHAHQRAMAGLAERSGPGDDSFWTWREVMYRFLARMDPDQFEAVAALAYLEMVEAGYTSVAEFHYLHHGPDGTPYADPAEMAERAISAARDVGIGITMLPVLYRHGGFGGAEPGAGQRRFVNDLDRFFAIAGAVRDRHPGNPQVAWGMAPHSLRAVTPDLLGEAVEHAKAMDPAAPIHIHVAEQRKEVEDCIAWCGRSPVRWLLDTMAVDARWCLIHCTHMDGGEIASLAASGAVAGVCPTTEANLGDGVFAAPTYLDPGGRLGIGSDSQISISPTEELRWLEYAQRLTSGGRTVLAGGPDRSTGRALLDRVLAGGAQACGRPIGAIAPGHRADIVILDRDAPSLASRAGDHLIDSWIFAAHGGVVRDVVVGGRTVVQAGHHPERDRIRQRYRSALADLLD